MWLGLCQCGGSHCLDYKSTFMVEHGRVDEIIRRSRVKPTTQPCSNTKHHTKTPPELHEETRKDGPLQNLEKICEKTKYTRPRQSRMKSK